MQSLAPTVSSATYGRAGAQTFLTSSTGLWSVCREQVLSSPSPPTETGDLAYRGTFSREQLEALNDPSVSELCSRAACTVWFGPKRHAVFYPVRAGSQFNLVLLRPDDLPQGVRTIAGDISEMRASFEGWDHAYVLYRASCLV